MRLFIVAIMCLVGTLSVLDTVSAQSTPAGFMLLSTGGQWYALVGVAPSSVSGTSASSVIYVVGVWSGPPGYTSPSDYGFEGTIYVTQYTVYPTPYSLNGETYSATSIPPPNGQPISMQGILVWSTSFPTSSTMLGTLHNNPGSPRFSH